MVSKPFRIATPRRPRVSVGRGIQPTPGLGMQPPAVASPFDDVRGLQALREGFQRGSGAPVVQQRRTSDLSELSGLYGSLRSGYGAGLTPQQAAGAISGPLRDGQGGGLVEQIRLSIRQRESNGNYNARGTPTKYGIARGAYQFLPTTYAAAAPRYGISPNDWSPAAQDKVAIGEINRLLQKFGGDPAKVAEAWYRGEHAVGKGGRNAPQVGGPPINTYIGDIVRGL